MGYNTTPRLITENLDLLREIRLRVERGETARFRVSNDAELSTEQYRLRRALAACDRHRTAFGGEFAGLGARVKLSVEAETSTLVVSPRTGVRVEAFRPSELEALVALRDAKGSLTVLEFWPSPSYQPEELERKAAALGWQVFLAASSTEPGGRVSIPAERTASFDSSEPDEPEGEVEDLGFKLL